MLQSSRRIVLFMVFLSLLLGCREDSAADDAANANIDSGAVSEEQSDTDSGAASVTDAGQDTRSETGDSGISGGGVSGEGSSGSGAAGDEGAAGTVDRVCEPGEYTCGTGMPVLAVDVCDEPTCRTGRCKEDGSGWDYTRGKQCSDDTNLCKDGKCVACVEDGLFCDGNDLNSCNDGVIEHIADCFSLRYEGSRCSCKTTGSGPHCGYGYNDCL